MFSRILPSSSLSPLEGRSQSIVQCWDFVLNQGEGIVPHKHTDVEEVYIILNGEGIMTIGTETTTVFAGEVVYVPLNTTHYIINVQKTPLRCLTIVAKVPKQVKRADMRYSLN